MMKLAVILSVIALGFAHPTSRIDPKVVGGTDSFLGQFPYQISLQNVGPLASEHYCGGSLIAPSTVLTAGHCVTNLQIGPFHHIEAHGAIINIKGEGTKVQYRKVKETIVHPDFHGQIGPYDLALHILTSPFELNEYLQIIDLPEPDSIPSGEVVLTGWGSTSNTSSSHMPNILQNANLTVIPFEECAAMYPDDPVDPTNVCTGPVTGSFGACKGDSGGPLAVSGDGNFTVVGIVSWGPYPCAQVDQPSIYTRVSAYVPWILDNLV